MKKHALARIAFATCLALFLGEQARAQSIVSSGSMRLALDGPSRNGVVSPLFYVYGWTLDMAAAPNTGIDAVHVWALPSAGGTPVFLGAATLGRTRPDVPTAAYGPASIMAGWDLNTTVRLKPGNYTLKAFGRQIASGTFAIAEEVPITVVGTTLSDIEPCTMGQVPQWNGTIWKCADPVGPQGPAGPTGPAGGAPGPAGPTGPAGGTGLSGITHTAGSAIITVSSAGTYLITWSLTVTGLTDGNLLSFNVPINGAGDGASTHSTEATGSGPLLLTGHYIRTLAAGATIRIRNQSGASRTISALNGGSTTGAAINIVRIAD